jgi:hypothetical protein
LSLREVGAMEGCGQGRPCSLNPGLTNCYHRDSIWSWYGGLTPVIPALGRLRHKNEEFETGLGYMESQKAN